MAITKTNVYGYNALRTWLNANACPDYFASVSTSNYSIYAIDSSNHTLFTFATTNAKIYKSESVYQEICWSSGMSYDSQVFTCVKCDGGILVLSTSSGSAFCFIITKTQSGTTAVICSMWDTRSTALTQNIAAVAWGDATDASKTLTFTSSVQNQTQFVPFTTYAQPDTVSYTPDAFYMPVGEYYDWTYGKFSDGTSTYITNGYWAIKDA